MKMTPYFKFFQDVQDQYRWTFCAANHEKLAVPGESFKRRAEAEASIDLVKRLAPSAPVNDLTKPCVDGHHGQSGKPEFEVYKDKADEYRWRLQSGNNTIIAISSEGYKGKSACVNGLELVKKFAPTAEVKDETRSRESSQRRGKTSVEPREGRFA
jgi:hypothetical protein